MLSALLREDVVGLRSRSTLLERPDGPWLRLPADPAAAALLLPLGEDGYQSTYAARLPLLVREADGARLTTTDDVLAALRALADPADHEGFDAFAEECRQTLATMRLHSRTRDETDTELTDVTGRTRAPGPAFPAAWRTTRWPLGSTTPSTPPHAAAPVWTSDSCVPTHRSSTRVSHCAGSPCRAPP